MKGNGILREKASRVKNMQTTLCYIEKDGRTLMLHRVKKKNDINHDKWLGVGGKFEYGEAGRVHASRSL